MFYYTYNEFLEDINKLAKRIKRENFKYDWIVAMSRGGIVPAGYLSQLLDMSTITTTRGEITGQTYQNAFLPIRQVSGNVLLVSDLLRTGKTIGPAKQRIEDNYNIKQLDILCLHYFPRTSILVPKYFSHKMPNKHFVTYPWET